MPWFAWFLLGAVLGGSIGCLAAALAFAAGEEQPRVLRAELRKQWESNHAEHCQWDWPHDGICNYPPPVVLGLR